MHRLLLNREIYEVLIQRYLPAARRYLWIVTADIKDLYVEAPSGFVPLLERLAQLVEQGVAVRLIHAKEPGPRFREDFDHYPVLAQSDAFERILCPRVHTKAMIIDGRVAFVGSPNLTGAGMGSKHADKRNFEAGFLFDEAEAIARLSDWIDSLYLGVRCETCRRRDFCPDPIA